MASLAIFILRARNHSPYRTTVINVKRRSSSSTQIRALLFHLTFIEPFSLTLPSILVTHGRNVNAGELVPRSPTRIIDTRQRSRLIDAYSCLSLVARLINSCNYYAASFPPLLPIHCKVSTPFSGELMSLLSSRHFVNAYNRLPLGKIIFLNFKFQIFPSSSPRP